MVQGDHGRSHSLPRQVDHGKEPVASTVQGDRGQSPTRTRSVRVDRGKSPATPPHQSSALDLGDEELEDEISYSIDPMDTIKKALKKENIKMISLACIRPMTQEIRARIKELKEQIKSYGEFLQPMTIETAETGIGSSDAPMRLLQSNVPMRIFDTPSVGLESIDEGTDSDQHDMLEHDETEPRTPHGSGDEPIVDD